LNFFWLTAQENSINNDWLNYLEELAEAEDADINSIEQLFDDLSYISEKPFNLKTITKTELERLPFLNALQIENLLYYIYKYGIADIHELKNVEELDMKTFTYLLPFVCVGGKDEMTPLKLKDALRYGKQEIILRTDRTVQQKAGYKQVSEDERAAKPNKYYIGDPQYMSLRYGYRYRDIQFGFAAEKDAGEAFWNKHYRGFDHYAFNFNLKNRGVLDDLHIGDYRLAFGQGLVVNTNFSMGKTTFISNIAQTNESIKRHASTNENGYFRGLAGNLKFGNMNVTIFGSHRLHDANTDSTTIYSFKTDGYNRTENDLEKRHAATINAGGGHIRWRTSNINMGLTGVYYSFGGKQLNPQPHTYNIFYLREKNFFNTGINYGFLAKRFVFQGETAIDGAGKTATVNNLLLNPASSVEWIISYRNYARDYNAFYAKAFSESATVQNESGIYSGVKLNPLKFWELSAYIDVFRYPWLKYGIDAPSEGIDKLAQLTFNPPGRWEFQAQYRHKQKGKNRTSGDGRETLTDMYDHHRCRLRISTNINQMFQIKTQVNYNNYSNSETYEQGFAITELLTVTPAPNLIIDACAGYYNTESYTTRINIYEKNILYAFSFPGYYGESLRLYSVIKWNASKLLAIHMKVGNIRHLDRETSGSDLEQIDGRDKTDINLLAKYSLL
jgi:hypothetical protein